MEKLGGDFASSQGVVTQKQVNDDIIQARQNARMAADDSNKVGVKIDLQQKKVDDILHDAQTRISHVDEQSVKLDENETQVGETVAKGINSIKLSAMKNSDHQANKGEL